MTLTDPTLRPLPGLWYEPAPRHFDLRAAWWFKMLIMLALAAAAILYLDQPLALWARAHPIPNLLDREHAPTYGDAGRELMFLEQFGQGSCAVLVVLAVALIDPKGRRRALAIGIACVFTVIVTHLLKDVVGRSRPFNDQVPDSATGIWLWGGPSRGFHGGTKWGSFPSAHTTAAFALASSLAWFYPRGRALFMALAIATATQRILHTAHYLSDTLVGMAIGVFMARSTLQAKIAGRMIALVPLAWQRWWFPDLR